MTPTMTPREKVARIVDPEAFDHPTVHPQHLVARRAVSFSKADAILTALASGSGDHAELAAKAERCTTGDPWYTDDDLRGRQSFGPFLPQDRAFIAAANPATVLALLAENAALRAVAEKASSLSMEQTDKLLAMHDRATEAERKLAEAVELLRETLAPGSFEGESEINARIRTFLSKEAERE